MIENQQFSLNKTEVYLASKKNKRNFRLEKGEKVKLPYNFINELRIFNNLMLNDLGFFDN